MCEAWFVAVIRALYEQLTEPAVTIPNQNGDNPTKIKCRNHQELFETWIDYDILKNSLIRSNPKLPSELNHNYDTGPRGKENLIKDLYAHLDSIGDEKDSGYEKLIDYLKYSLKDVSFVHLGHVSLLKLLTTSDSEKSILESDDYRRNEAIQQIVKNEINVIIELTDVNVLLPFMYKEKLLTLDETQSCLDRKNNPAKWLLRELLDTKGHRGYIVFLECLENSIKHENHYHPGHSEIIKQINLGLKGFHIGKCTGEKGVPF